MARIHQLFDRMLETGASDLHLAEGQPAKLRLHGAVKPVDGFPVLERSVIEPLLREIISEDRWELYQKRGDMDFAYGYGTKARFRCNYLRQYAGYGAVFRTIPSKILSLEQLGAPRVIHTFADFASGLCLVTGPTGSGKSTTLAGVIDSINSNQGRIILTIEEPIEFVHPQKRSTIIQREVHEDCSSFGEALRASSRQDADVILVGEMRDLETIALAVSAAEKGILVFGTLHTNSATKTINRIIDVFPAEEQRAVRESLAVALRGVCAQLLLKRCDKPGRIACHEVLVQTRAASNLIREGNTGQLVQVIMSGKSVGMQLMDDAIKAALDARIIEGEEAYMKAINKDSFKEHAPKFLEG